jgi:hypothetical protein
MAINPMIEKNKIVANKKYILPKLFWAMFEKIYHQFLVTFNCHSK